LICGVEYTRKVLIGLLLKVLFFRLCLVGGRDRYMDE
jgi:hypothetical protein